VNTAALLLETLQLGADPDPARLRDAWPDAALGGLLELAAFEGCTLWLYQRLRGPGVLDALSRAFAQSLERAARREAAQNLRVDAETETILRRLETAGVPSVLIKGVARRAASALYPYSDARATSDVDLLVPAADAPGVWRSLAQAGYHSVSSHPVPEAEGQPHHLPPLLGPGRVAVEIHTSTSRRVAPEEAWRRSSRDARVLRWSGLDVRVPPPTELLWHSVTHAAREHELYETGFRLRYFQDAAVILAASDGIDWVEIGRRLESSEIEDRDAMLRWLGAAATLGGRTFPNALGRARSFNLERSLRWRLGVFRWLGRWPRLAGHLLTEEIRTELGQPPARAAAGASLVVRCRHGIAAGSARTGYRLWRALQRGPASAGPIYRPAPA